MLHTQSLRRRTAALLAILFCSLVIGCGGAGTIVPAGNDPDPDPGPFEWQIVPDVTVTEGYPVEVDLRAHLGGETAATVITLDETLPAGLQLTDGVIRGTPTTASEAALFVASADEDGLGTNVILSNSFSITVLAPSGLLEFERPTPEQIGIHLPLGNEPLAGTLPDSATATVRYKKSTDSTWQIGHPLLRIHPEWISAGAPQPPVDAFAGTIFGLEPGTTYDVEVTVSAPDMSDVVLDGVHTTRSLPSATGSATVNASPTDDVPSIVNALQPGDVLELANGTYNVDPFVIKVSGTAQAPITIRGASRAGVVLKRPTGTIVQFTTAKHVVLENLTLQGSGSDSGIAASSRGVVFWDGAVQEYITIRGVDMIGVDQGFIAAGPAYSILLYDCDMQGNNLWNLEFVHSNLTWNDDGVRVPGEGNCVFNNTMDGFGDSLAVNNGVFSAAVYFYRNRIKMTGDDAWEADYGTRNIAFYDNHVQNCSTLMSCDPVWGGPAYCFRNIAVNTARGPYKLNSTQSGMLVYNNTVVRVEGRSGWGWVQFNNGALRNWSYRNNLIVYHGGTNLMAIESTGNDPIDFTHNGWYPDGSIWWSTSGPSGGSLAEVFSKMGDTTPVFGTSTKRHDHDIIVGAEPFDSTIPLGADHLTEVTSMFVPTLGNSSAARNAGTPIPNVTDGHSGESPDMGAVIDGRANPSWGASR